ncbi:MAG: transcription termination/antitermination protein NusA [Chloroflexi bacterium]|nr:transcription termination/antitermination protein NusA [Chloroflexota bacterium]
MKSEFLLAFNQICSERNLPKEVVLEALTTALVSAYRRDVNASSAQNITAVIDGQTGLAQIYAEKEVTEIVQDVRTEVTIDLAQQIVPDAKLGDMVMVESTPEGFGRIAAQTAKQVILQRIREAERDAQYNLYAEREGEIINGVVQSIGGPGITLNLGRTEALMPKKEQVPSERYQMHQRLRAYVMEVRKSSRGPQIIVSRAHKNMLRRLLELEVPEIYNGTVEIKSIAREAGARSKLAVAAAQPGIDPVGACVGMRGVRIQSIVSELGGEKIDVIEWSPEPAMYIQKALSPARVLTVHPEDDPRDGKIALVVVPDDQLSLAIGREGQNARLAAKLTAWRIDIKGSTEAARDAVALVENDLALRERLGPAAAYALLVKQALQRHAEQSLPWNAEELQTIKQLLDGIHHTIQARKQAEREQARAAAAALMVEKPIVVAAPEGLDTSKQDAVNLYRARIPITAYSTPVVDLGISPRVLSHIERSGLTNVGQIHERLATGDEAMLVIDGIGPKGLTEIKQAIEDRGLGLVPLPEPTPVVPEPVAEAPVAIPAAAAEAVAEVAPAATVPAETPTAVIEAAAPETSPAAVKPAGESELAPVGVASGEVVEESEDDDEIDRKTGKKKVKRKDRMLVLDESTGVVVAKKQRKAGRGRGDLFGLDEDI